MAAVETKQGVYTGGDFLADYQKARILAALIEKRQHIVQVGEQELLGMLASQKLLEGLDGDELAAAVDAGFDPNNLATHSLTVHIELLRQRELEIELASLSQSVGKRALNRTVIVRRLSEDDVPFAWQYKVVADRGALSRKSPDDRGKIKGTILDFPEPKNNRFKVYARGLFTRRSFDGGVWTVTPIDDDYSPRVEVNFTD